MLVMASTAARAALDDISAMACSTLQLTRLCANCVSERADSEGEGCVFLGSGDCLFSPCDSAWCCTRDTRTGRRPCVSKPLSAHF